MADDIFEMVVVIINEEEEHDTFGIKGPLNGWQKRVIMDATDKYISVDEVIAALVIITGDDTVIHEFGLTGGILNASTIRSNIIPRDQVVRITSENWPRYPVLSSTFMAYLSWGDQEDQICREITLQPVQI